MLRFIQLILQWLQGGTLKLLLLAGVLLLGWGTIAPVGTLVWWMRQGSQSLGLNKDQTKNLPRSTGAAGVTNSTKIDCYIVYLPGVGDFSTDETTPGEKFFLDQLVQLHPDCVAVRDVFPYSAANESLGGERLLAPLWRVAKKDNADFMIKIRNLWRFAISADKRYGPIYNQGIATAIIERMNAAYPILQSHKQPLKVILIGDSGGAQVALGAASYLHQWLNNTHLIVVSLGGSFDGRTGFEAVEHVYQLGGRQDWVKDITGIVFASRWKWTVGSPFNQAIQQGRYTVISSGPHTHDGAKGYFGTTSVENSKITYVQLTLQKVNQLPIWSK